MQNRSRTLISCCCAALIALAGCGVKGDLYLPQPLPAEDANTAPAKNT